MLECVAAQRHPERGIDCAIQVLENLGHGVKANAHEKILAMAGIEKRSPWSEQNIRLK